MGNLEDFVSDIDGAKTNERVEVPKGEYAMELKGSSVDSKFDGEILEVTLRFAIVEGDYEGQNLFVPYCIKSNRPKVQEIGRSQLKQTYKALGFDTMPSDTSEGHGCRCRLKFDYYESQSGYRKVNFKSAKPYAAEESPF